MAGAAWGVAPKGRARGRRRRRLEEDAPHDDGGGRPEALQRRHHVERLEVPQRFVDEEELGRQRQQQAKRKRIRRPAAQ
eukprot:7214252-Prymnesium_polylepis.1